MPLHVMVRINVGGKTFYTSLHTLMEGARLKSVVFQALCLQILGPGPWDQRVVPVQNPQYGVEHFVDADPTPWPIWLEYLRSGENFDEAKAYALARSAAEDMVFTCS